MSITVNKIIESDVDICCVVNLKIFKLLQWIRKCPMYTTKQRTKTKIMGDDM